MQPPWLRPPCTCAPRPLSGRCPVRLLALSKHARARFCTSPRAGSSSFSFASVDSGWDACMLASIGDAVFERGFRLVADPGQRQEPFQARRGVAIGLLGEVVDASVLVVDERPELARGDDSGGGL